MFHCLVSLGEDFKTVQKEVADILNGRILVGHALHNDLKVTKLQTLKINEFIFLDQSHNTPELLGTAAFLTVSLVSCPLMQYQVYPCSWHQVLQLPH